MINHAITATNPLIPSDTEDIVCQFAWNFTAVLYLILTDTWSTDVSKSHKFQAYSILVITVL